MTTLLLTDPTNPRCVLPERRRTRTRLSAHLRAHSLDRALASGASPDSNAALLLRAQKLIDARTRGALARSVRQLIDDARRPLAPFAARVPICRRKIFSSAESLQALADRLVSSDPVDARGVAMVSLLLTDGCGPVYNRPPADDLEPALERALLALEVTA
jgi:hypothetical protein